MAQDAAATFSRTVVAWSFPTGADIALKGGRNLVPSGISGALLDDITAGLFTTSSNARLSNPSFMSLPNLSVELLIQPTTITSTGFIVRAGSPTVGSDFGFSLRLLNLASNPGPFWGFVRRGTLGTNVNNVHQVVNGTTAIVLNQLYHVVVVVQEGVNGVIYINGETIPVTIGNFESDLETPFPPGPLTGPIPILATYELSVGDPRTSQNGFAGTLGRVIIYPYAMTAAQAAASARLQLAQARSISIGATTPAGQANHGPVATPFLAGPVIADGVSSIQLDTPTSSFDADGDPLTAIAHPTSPSQGVSQIVANQLRYTPNGGSGNGPDHVVPFRIRDPALLQGSGEARVRVLNPGSDSAIPNTPVNINVANITDLVAQYNTVQPNTTLWVTFNIPTDAAVLNFNRTGIPAGQPIIIRPLNGFLTQSCSRRILLQGANHIFAGFDFSNVNGTNITMEGNNVRVSRCRIIHSLNATCQGVLSQIGSDHRCDRVEVSIRTGAFTASEATGESVCLRLGPTGSLPLRTIFERCWIHDCDLLPSGLGSVNGREGIQLGEGFGSRNALTGTIVRFTLLENVKNESETVSVKSSGNQLINLMTKRGSNLFVSRVGNDNLWTACRSENSGGFRMWMRRHIYTGCETDSSGIFDLRMGNATSTQYDNTGDPDDNRPAAESCELRHCSGRIEIGRLSGDASLWNTPIFGPCRFRTHTGTVVVIANPTSGSHNFTQTSDAPGTKPAIEDLNGGSAPAPGVNVGVWAP